MVKRPPFVLPWGAAALVCGVALLAQGCSSEPGAAEQDRMNQQMRASYDRKSYSLNDVPPGQRERVKALMAASQRGVPSVSATSAGPAAKQP